MLLPIHFFYFSLIFFPKFLSSCLLIFVISFLNFLKIYLFLSTYFWLCWVFVAVRGLSLVAASRGYSSLGCVGLSLRWLLLLRSTDSRHTGFSSCGAQAQWLWLVGSRAQAQLWCMGLAAPRHVGSSWTRAQTHVPCIGRQIINHCATREAHHFLFFKHSVHN